jgi:hypothetical protein
MDYDTDDRAHSDHNVISTMHKTVYFLVHKDTGERLKYYKTLAGARIAQHSRNARLGFRNRIERVEQFNNWEAELYTMDDGTVVEGTYCIIEDTVDSNLDLLS